MNEVIEDVLIVYWEIALRPVLCVSLVILYVFGVIKLLKRWREREKWRKI